MGITKNTIRAKKPPGSRRRWVGSSRHKFVRGLKWPKYKSTSGLKFRPNPKNQKEWLVTLRPRTNLPKRGQATALGIRLVKEQLRTINADLAEQLLAKSTPFGFGTLSSPLSRETELQDCLYELREMISTLQFHLDLNDRMELPRSTSFGQTSGQKGFGQTTYKYITLLSKDDEKVGKIALVGLVNRFSSAVFSDHHGLVLQAQINDHPDLNIYYHSLDATHNFSGGTTIRSKGGMLPYTGPLRHDTSLRGAVGFSQQLFKLMLEHPKINVIILAEVGQEEAKQLLKGSKAFEWQLLTKKGSQRSNDVTMVYHPSIAKDYSFSVKSTDIGIAAQILFGKGTSSEGSLLGCHILNSMAENKKVGAFMDENGVSAIFGDTNISTKGSSLKFGFKTIESNTSTTDSLTFDFSNSASDTMFDKLLVRTSE